MAKKTKGDGAARARVIAFANQKGGVAKSTTAEAFAASLTARGYNVLMVDMDAQPGNLSMHVGADKSLPGTLELLELRRPTKEKALRCVQPTQSFGDVICADEKLGDADKSLNSHIGRELMLSRALDPLLEDYDFVIIDTPPALQVRTLNGIAAADDVVVPCMADASSVAGMETILEYVAEVEEYVRGAEPHVAGVVVTRYDARNSLEPEMLNQIAEIAAEHDVPLLGQGVRNTVNARKAQCNGVPLGELPLGPRRRLTTKRPCPTILPALNELLVRHRQKRLRQGNGAYDHEGHVVQQKINDDRVAEDGVCLKEGGSRTSPPYLRYEFRLFCTMNEPRTCSTRKESQ